MQRLRNAFRFIEACFSKIISISRGHKNWLSFFVGAVIILAVWLIPLALIIRFIGLTPVGLGLIGLIAGCIFFSLALWGKVNALVTCQVFFQAIQENDADLSPDLKDRVRQKHWSDAVLWFFAMPWLQFAYRRAQFFQNQVKNEPFWLDAYHLIIPLIAIEDLSFSQAVQRAKDIHEEKLLRFQSDLIPVRLVGTIVQWVLILGGAIIGLLVAFNIAYATTTGFRRRLLGMGVGLIIVGATTLIGMAFKNVIEACYHTALYQWIRNVASARQAGEKGLALAPDILRQVFGNRNLIVKEK